MDGQTINGLQEDDYDGIQQQQQSQQKGGQPKALRFVTNYGAPHPKRRRIAAACLTCRKRKTACSGERPTCETCSQNKLDCAGYASDAPAPGHKKTASDTNHEMDERPRKVVGQEFKHEQESESGLQGHHSDGHQAPLAWPTSNVRESEDLSFNGVANEGVKQDSEIAKEAEANESLFSGPRNRMPYFRWLGPTAIMPGFKQMVVKVKRQDTDVTRSSNEGALAGANLTSPSVKSLNPNGADQRMSSVYSTTPTAADGDARTPLNLPFYDTSSMPPSELITHLANTFFTHLGCNYPFLQRERFMRDLEEKQVDAILVDAVCALAARFSTHSLITQQFNDEDKTSPAEYGHAFAQRAQKALVDTFPCPTVAAVQAALLLAYNEFGENRDSGLWMYLGISIRMAQDLGLHKVEGLKYKGKSGPTPKMIKKESMNGSPELPTKLVSGKREKDAAVEKAAREKVVRETVEGGVEAKDQADEQKEVDEQKAVEQERTDTFWAVFFLDRCVSSGTGRRSTLRDKDIELSFPALDETDPKSGWPAPFPALIRIVHLYGRVADLLNSIKEPSDITSETPKRMASMESQVTNFYQGLSSRLHFDAVNFQHYMKAGEGTNFVLLHFWFHTLIVVLHQPTLLKTFEGRMLQLFPNSQQLAMSSAKTIADILSYSQLMDAKASLGNPFTTQPIYIAACAFLKETVEQTATSNAQSRDSSPSRKTEKKDGSEERPPSTNETPHRSKRMSIDELSNPVPAESPPSKNSASSMVTERHKSSDKSELSTLSASRTASALAKHTLLATAASQHYQLCYKALESLYTYWAGTKYILTVLDQKFKGVRDPLLYTVEEGESALEQPRPEPSFTSPGWRRKLSWETYLYGPNVKGADFWREKAGQMPGSPSGGDIGKAIGWTLTGTMNSPSTNLAWHYPSATSAGPEQQSKPGQRRAQQSSGLPGLISMASSSGFSPPAPNMQSNVSDTASTSQQSQSMANYASAGNIGSNANNAGLFMGLNSPYQSSNTLSDTANDTFGLQSTISNDLNGSHHGDFTSMNSTHDTDQTFGNWNYDSLWDPNNPSMQPFGDMMIESQDVDMSMLGLDMMPWFDPTQDFTGFFDTPGQPSPAGPGGAPAVTGAQSTPRG